MAEKKLTKGVEILLGNPKKALFKLALPIMATNFIQTIYTLVDTVWVAGIGSNALAAVGFFFPFFFIAMAIALGIGIGGGAAISRRIGADDRAGAGSVAIHTMVIMFISSILYSLPLIIFMRPLFTAIGALSIIDLTVSYGRIIVGGSIFIFFSGISTAILRAEGDTKRAMFAMVFGNIVNIILDPILIYYFKLGVAGAAWATIISVGISSMFLFDWLFLKSNTYVPIHFKGFHFKKDILSDIFKVGLPASFQHAMMAISTFIINLIVVHVGGPDGVAVLMSGWRIVMLGTMPVFGIAAAIVSIAGAAFGANDIPKMKAAYHYAIKSGLLLELVVGGIICIYAPWIVKIFTYSKEAAHLEKDLILFVRIISLTFPAVAIGPTSGALFQAMGRGMTALLITILRTIILVVPLMVLFALILNMGLPGVWLGIGGANLIGATTALIWANIVVNKKLRLSQSSI